MIIQLASDLHLERLGRDHPCGRIVEPVPQADVLVLAGDVHGGIQAVEAFGDWPVPVIYVAGNHEFDGHGWHQLRRDLRAACSGSRIAFLDDDGVVVDGVRFLGSTLWTDFQLPGRTQPEWMLAVERDLCDRDPRLGPAPFSSHALLEDHRRSRSWLERQLALPFAGRTVVVSHHGPHPRSIHARHAGSGLNAGFASDLTPLLARADLWLHGHVHDSVAYDVAGCRVVANPAGYLQHAPSVATRLPRFENPAFDPELTVDVAAAT